MKRFLFAIFTLITVVATAQPKAVTWSTSIEHTEEFTLLTVHADIEPGWHLYSQNLADGGPIPTSFMLDTSSSFTAVGVWEEGEPHVEFDPNFDMDLAYFSESADFTIKLQPHEEDFSIAGELEFMVCNDEMCLPPTYEDFNASVTGAPVPSIW